MTTVVRREKAARITTTIRLPMTKRKKAEKMLSQLVVEEEVAVKVLADVEKAKVKAGAKIFSFYEGEKHCINIHVFRKNSNVRILFL